MSTTTTEEGNAQIYSPLKVLQHPDFRILSPGEKPPATANIAAFYNPCTRNSPLLLHVRATGICGSDVHFWQHGRIGDSMVVTDECGSGHESAGEVVEVGEGVTQWNVGDRVAIEAGVPCSQPSCDACRTGRYNACPDVVFFSTPPFHGTLTRWHLHPAQWLHALPDNVSFEEGSLCEPLAVALAGIERSGLRLGDPLLICGAGPIGLITLLSARAAGAEPVVITDLFQSRLDFAKKLVPGVRTVLIKRGTTPKEQAQDIKEAAGGALKLAMECTWFFIIGVGKNEQLFPFMVLSANEIDLSFQYRYANQVRSLPGGLIDIKPLVTHRFPLEEAVAAFHVAADPAQD
ncbi:chaperonin 10-like protein [Mycena filopes]|nr:chaperonin 10-like protein [Mycena filopes]